MSSGIVTLIAMLAFVAVVVWVFVIKRKEDFDEQAHMPLEDEDQTPGSQRQAQPEEGKDKEQGS